MFGTCKARASQVAQWVKDPSANAGDDLQMQVSKDPLEQEMATHSSIPAWKIPWATESRTQLSMCTHTHTHTHTHSIQNKIP